MNAGEFYKHLKRPEWGVAEVLEVTGDKVCLNFEHGGRKILLASTTNLERAHLAAAIPFRIDLRQLEMLCRRFHADLEHNRRGSDDGTMAMRVLDDVKRRGLPTKATQKQHLDWCHTEGNPFQSGVALAREICIAVYGRVLADPDKMCSTK